MNIQKLTAAELREIRRLTKTMCANYDNHYRECLLLDSTCYMMDGVAYKGDVLCKYFRNAVLPLNPKLEAVFAGIIETKPCKICDTEFVPTGRQAYCSAKCRNTSSQLSTVARVRKYRQRKQTNVTK